MADKAHAVDPKAGDEAAPSGPPAKRSMHRHTDPRDTVAEMAARAQEISQEAGSRIGKAMKDIISAAAGLAGFAVESARDLAQYMVRRGQMTQEEADKLIQEAEAAFAKRAKPTKPAASPAATARKAAPPTPTAKPTAKPAAKSAAAKKGAKPKATKTAVRASTPKKKSAATSVRTKSPAKPAKKKK